MLLPVRNLPKTHTRNRRNPCHSHGRAVEVLELRWLLSSVSGTIFDDLNGNGRQDAEETGIAGWTVTATNPNDQSFPKQVLAQATTDENGVYQFDVSTFGSVQIQAEIPDGWQQTTKSISLTDDEFFPGSPFSSAPTAVGAGNFDLDGQNGGIPTDELVVTRTGSNVVEFFDYSPDAEQWLLNQSVSVPVLPGELVVGDFTQDNAPDVVVVQYLNSSNPGVNVLVNAGDGTFGSPSFVGLPILSGSSQDRPKAIAAGQFNDDNDDGHIDDQDWLDLVVASDNDEKLSILLNQGIDAGAPVFSVTSLARSMVPSGNVALATDDFDGKLGVDIALVSNENDSAVLTVFLNDGNGDFSQSVQTVSLGDSRAVSSIAAGTLVGDSASDLVIVTFESPPEDGGFNGEIRIHENVGGTFSETSTLAAGGTGPMNVGLADFDLDGDPDLAIAYGDGTQPQFASDVAINLGQNSSGVHEFVVSQFTGAPLDGGLAPYGAAFGDWDGDGDTDWALPDRGGNNRIATRTSSPAAGPYVIGQFENLTRLDFGAAEILPFDLNQDGSVNTADLSAMRGQLLAKLSDESHGIPARFDTNGDGSINTADLSAVRGHLLQLLEGSQSARPQSPVNGRIPALETADPESTEWLIDYGPMIPTSDPLDPSPDLSSDTSLQQGSVDVGNEDTFTNEDKQVADDSIAAVDAAFLDVELESLTEMLV